MRYFQPEEFDSPDLLGSGAEYMDYEFMLMIDDAREIADMPFIITSGYRTPEHNANVGGSPTSSHTRGYAADIAYDRPSEAVRIIAALTEAGFNRIGMSSNFIHVDNDPDKPPAYWDYG